MLTRRVWAVCLVVLVSIRALPCVVGKFKFNHNPQDGMCQRAGRPYLIAEVNGGLNNARWVMLEYLASAKRHNLTFVAGTLNMELMGECNNNVGFQHFSMLYSLDALLDFAHHHDITVVTEISPAVQAQCCAALEEAEKQEDPALGDVTNWLQTRHPNQAVCLNYHQGFYLLPSTFGTLPGWSSVDFSLHYLEAKELDMYRAALQPSPAVRQVVAYVLRALRRLYGEEVLSERRTLHDGDGKGRRLVERLGASQRLGGSVRAAGQQQQHKDEGGQRLPTRFNFTSVHVRIENDFRGHCAHFSKVAKRRCFFKEEEIATLLRDTYHVPPGSLLQVASGEPLSAMPVLCSMFRCFRALDIWEQGAVKDAFGPCATREARGAVEFWVATHARAFYGNVHSSFSAELVAEFRRMGRPGEFYTHECQVLDETCT